MNMTNEEYNEYIKRKQPRSPLGMDMLRAFLVGGLICAGGEGLRALYTSLGLDTESAGTAVSISLVFLGALLTGLGLYDDIARFAGAVHHAAHNSYADVQRIVGYHGFYFIC